MAFRSSTADKRHLLEVAILDLTVNSESDCNNEWYVAGLRQKVKFVTRMWNESRRINVFHHVSIQLPSEM